MTKNKSKFDFKKISTTVASNAESVWYKQEKQISFVCDLITGDFRYIVLGGLGNSGLVAKKFGLRLNQILQVLFKTVKVFGIGEISTPKITSKDIIVIVSGSGDKETQIPIIEEAKRANATIILFTSFPDSALGKLASIIVNVPGRILDKKEATMPMGTIFEDSTVLVCTGISGKIIYDHNIREEALKDVHTNLE